MCLSNLTRISRSFSSLASVSVEFMTETFSSSWKWQNDMSVFSYFLYLLLYIYKCTKYSIHQNKVPVYTCVKARGTKGKEFQNKAWPSLDQLNGECGASRRSLAFNLATLSFEYPARQKCVLSFWRDYSARFRQKNIYIGYSNFN